MTFLETILALSRSPELSILLKATVLLALALVAVRLARHASAAVRHLILAGAFAALVALPLVIAAAPAVRVDIAVTPSKPAQTVAAAPAPRSWPSLPHPVARQDGFGVMEHGYADALGRRHAILGGSWDGNCCGCGAFNAPESPGWKAAIWHECWLPNVASAGWSMFCSTRRSQPQSPAAPCVPSYCCPSMSEAGAKTISGARSFTNWNTCDAGIGRCSR